MSDAWGVKFCGANTGLYFKKHGKGKGTRGVENYVYKLHTNSSFTLLHDKSHSITVVSSKVAKALKPDALFAETASALDPTQLKLQTQVMKEADRDAVQKRSGSSCP